MNENMNRFAFNTEGKICDYGYEEPKVLSEQEILEELNNLENANYEFMMECQNLNWQVEYLQDQCDKKDTKIAKMQRQLKKQPKRIVNKIKDYINDCEIIELTTYTCIIDFLDNLLKEYGNE